MSNQAVRGRAGTTAPVDLGEVAKRLEVLEAAARQCAQRRVQMDAELVGPVMALRELLDEVEQAILEECHAQQLGVWQVRAEHIRVSNYVVVLLEGEDAAGEEFSTRMRIELAGGAVSGSGKQWRSAVKAGAALLQVGEGRSLVEQWLKRSACSSVRERSGLMEDSLEALVEAELGLVITQARVAGQEALAGAIASLVEGWEGSATELLEAVAALAGGDDASDGVPG